MPYYTIITPDFKISKKMITEHNLARKNNCYKRGGKRIPSPLPPLSNKILQIIYFIIDEIKLDHCFEVGFKESNYTREEQDNALSELITILRKEKRMIKLSIDYDDPEGTTITNIFSPDNIKIIRQFI